VIINGLQKYSFSLEYQTIEHLFFKEHFSARDTQSFNNKKHYVCSMERLKIELYKQDAVTVAEKLLGKTIVRVNEDNSVSKFKITETEAYLGEEDGACHANKGRTARTDIMYAEGGKLYVYLIYGMYWMLNVVTGSENHPQAVLIRGIDDIIGSGKVGRKLKIDKSFYGESLIHSSRIWIENEDDMVEFITAPRIGIDYAGDEWKLKPWRFILKNKK
jgi:DNA-3-methyladenine glycosylase